MRPIGYSTGAIAYGNFNKALEILKGSKATAIELSALRDYELEPLASAINDLDLSQFVYVSVHAPSRFEKEDEPRIIKLLSKFIDKKLPVIVHPDAIYSFERWDEFGKFLFVENMDKRKPIGRTVDELDIIFEKLPNAYFCFDIAHARQFDPTMNNASSIISKYSHIMGQLHVSEVCSCSNHIAISKEAELDYSKVAKQIPPHVPIIIETLVKNNKLETEINAALRSLTTTS